MRARRRFNSRTITRAIAALPLFLSPAALFAQSCALCYQSASASGPKFIQALRHGILIMFFPPLLIMGAILFAAYRKRNQFNGGESASPEDYELGAHSSSI